MKLTIMFLKNLVGSIQRLEETLLTRVRFTIYLELIEKENLVKKAAENGAYLLSKLLELQKIAKD